MEQLFTISVFTENKVGILNRITIIFTRRHLNIESITASESQINGVYRYIFVVKATEVQVKKVVAQIEKLVEVIKSFYYSEEKIVYQELALYKVQTSALNDLAVERIIREHHARVLTIDAAFVIIEKTGHEYENWALFEALHPFGVLEFARSGRVAITKPMKTLAAYLEEISPEFKLRESAV